MKRQGFLAEESATGPIGPREIRRKAVTILEKVGEGAFGEVCGAAISLFQTAIQLGLSMFGTVHV